VESLELLYDHLSIGVTLLQNLFIHFAIHDYSKTSSLTILCGYRKPKQLQLSEEDKVENARRFEFVQGLLLSTILDDKLWLHL